MNNDVFVSLLTDDVFALDATVRDGTGRVGTVRGGTGRDGAGRDGTVRDGTMYIAEFKRMSYDPSYWDDEVEALFTDWADYKNKKADRTTGTVDYSNFEICWVHALACLIIVTGGNGHSNFICQDLADMTPNAVNKLVNGTFSLCLRARVPGVSMMHTGTSIRIGAINEMVEHKDASLYFCILRSGHSIENRILEYCLPTDVPLLITARILAGWPHPTKRHFSPRLIRLFESFNQLERVCFNNFMSSVFCSCEDFKTERLRGFQEMLMAVFLMHLDDFCSKYGSTHLICCPSFGKVGKG